MKSSEAYSTPNTLINAAIPAETLSPVDSQENTLVAAVEKTSSSSYFCCNKRHPRSKCPAKDATCAKCQKKDTLPKFVKVKLPQGYQHLYTHLL